MCLWSKRYTSYIEAGRLFGTSRCHDHDRIILRFKTDILDDAGNNYYVFWISGERRKRYATERDVFMLEDIQMSFEFYRHFNVIDVTDDGRMSRWLRGILHDKALGLID